MMHTIQTDRLNGGPQAETYDLLGKMPPFEKRFEKRRKKAAGPIPGQGQQLFIKPGGEEVRKNA